MSTKNYLLIAVLSLGVLCSSSFALLIDNAQTFTTNDNHPLYYFMNVAPDSGEGPGVTRIVDGGYATFTNRVNFDRVLLPGDPPVILTCKFIMDGGNCDMLGDVDFPDTTGPVRVYLNDGTWHARRIANRGETRNSFIYIGDGELIVDVGYDPLLDNEFNPKFWIAKGSVLPQPGYDLVLEDLGLFDANNPEFLNSARIYAVKRVDNPVPADDDTIVNLNLPSLCWDSHGVKIYKVWFGAADANESNYQTLLTYRGKSAVVADPNITTNLCYSLAGLTPLSAPATYSWALEAYSSVVGGEPNGPVMNVKAFQFSTSVNPVVKVQPVSAAYLPGQTATFTAEVDSYTALTSWYWYKTTAPSTPIAGAIQSLGGFRYRLTLTIPNVQWATQGKYYCTAANASGSVNTAEANLVVKAELARWTFTDNLLDTAPKTANPVVYNGTAAVTPGYVASSGLDTKALSFDGTSQYVTLPSGFGNFQAGMTIAVYFRMDDNIATPNSRFIEFGNADPTQSIYLAHRGTTGDELTFFSGGTRGTEGEEGLRLNMAYNLGAWSHVVVTMDNGGNVVCYKNGLPVTGVTGTVAVPVQIARDNNRIGWDRAGLVAKFKGIIGDLRVYNYAITPDDIADLYAGLNGPFCRQNPALDLGGNCFVDVQDLVIFAGNWLECGRWPASDCYN